MFIFSVVFVGLVLVLLRLLGFRLFVLRVLVTLHDIGLMVCTFSVLFLLFLLGLMCGWAATFKAAPTHTATNGKWESERLKDRGIHGLGAIRTMASQPAGQQRSPPARQPTRSQPS